MRTLDPTPQFPAVARGLTAVPLPGDRWRVTRDDGAVLGYVERTGPGFRCLRRVPRGADLRLVADVGSPDDALEVLRSA